MNPMILRRGDAGDTVKALQRGLNKLGAMLLVDGRFENGTVDAVSDAWSVLKRTGPPQADDSFVSAVAEAPDPFPPATAAGLTFIARQEVTSASAYRQKYQKPCWPSAQSGITIGIGYDCQFVSPDQFRQDWSEWLPDDAIERLLTILGRVGSREGLAALDSVSVPLNAAVTVFAKRSLQQCLASTRGIYPQVDRLSPPRKTALLSLVYNRGARLTDKDPRREERREMRTIQDLLNEGRDDEVAAQFESMTRLWDGAGLAGLVQRRKAEATLWRMGFTALQLD